MSSYVFLFSLLLCATALKVTTPENDGTYSAAAFGIEGTAKLGEEGKIIIDGEITHTISVPNERETWRIEAVDLTEGIHTVEYLSENSRKETITFTISNELEDDLTDRAVCKRGPISTPAITSPASPAYTASKQPYISGTCSSGTSGNKVSAAGLTDQFFNCPSGTFGFTWAQQIPDGTYDLYAYTYNCGSFGSASAKLELHIDTAPPSSTPAITTPSPPGPYVTASKTPTVQGTCTYSDAKFVLIETNPNVGTKVVNCGASNSWGATLDSINTDGTYAVTAKARDEAENAGSASASLSFTIDTTPPTSTPSITVPGSPFVTASTGPTIQGTCNSADAPKVQITAVGSPTMPEIVTDCSNNAFSATLGPNLSDGTYTVVAKARDEAWNHGPASNSLTMTIDTTPPTSTPSITTPSSPFVTASKGPTIQGSCNSADAPKVQITAVGSPTMPEIVTDCSNNAFSASLGPNLNDGTYTVVAKARDEAWNHGSASNSLTMTIDTTPPTSTPSITTPSSPFFTAGTSPYVSGTCSSADAPKVQITAVGSPTMPEIVTDCNNDAFSASLGPNLSDGTYTVVAKARDEAWNHGPASASLELHVDTVSPTSVPTISVPTSPFVTASTSPYFEGICDSSDSDFVQIQMRDSSNNVAFSKSFACTSNSWSGSAGTIGSDGDYSVTVRAHDKAINFGSESSVFSLTIDTTSPTSTPTITTPGPSPYYTASQNPYFDGTCDSSDANRIVLSGSPGLQNQVTPCTNNVWQVTWAEAIPEGTYTIVAKAYDAAGNVGNREFKIRVPSDPLTLIVDLTPPAKPTLTTPADGDGDKIALPLVPYFSGEAEAESTVKIFCDGKLYDETTADNQGKFVLSDGPELTEGSHTCYVTASDKAEVESAKSDEATFNVKYNKCRCGYCEQSVMDVKYCGDCKK